MARPDRCPKKTSKMATAVVHTNGTKQLEYVLGFIQTEQFSVKIEKKKNIGINDVGFHLAY